MQIDKEISDLELLDLFRFRKRLGLAINSRFIGFRKEEGDSKQFFYEDIFMNDYTTTFRKISQPFKINAIFKGRSSYTGREIGKLYLEKGNMLDLKNNRKGIYEAVSLSLSKLKLEDRYIPKTKINLMVERNNQNAFYVRREDFVRKLFFDFRTKLSKFPDEWFLNQESNERILQLAHM